MLSNKNAAVGAQTGVGSINERGAVIVTNAPDGDLYHLFIPYQAVGANLVYFDLFNNHATKSLQIDSILPIPAGDVAVTGVVSVELYLTRTTAVGTGGTVDVKESTALTATPSISKINPASADCPSTVTARLTPSGGATAGAVLAFRSVFTEETNAAAYDIKDLVIEGASIVVAPGKGIRVVQGAVASVGNIGFNVLFSLGNM